MVPEGVLCGAQRLAGIAIEPQDSKRVVLTRVRLGLEFGLGVGVRLQLRLG